MNQNNISLEKVIKELARIRDDHFGGMTSYEGEVLDAALALLKAQEPVAVIPAIKKDNELLREGNCSVCGMKLDWFYNGNYCGCCGQAVKWK